MERIGIIGAGNWIVDQIKQMDRWPGEGNLADIIREEPPAGGGGPNNVLHDLAKMAPEIPLYAVGRIGDDPAGEFLLSEARKDRIDCTKLTVSQTAPTSYTLVMAADGKRTFFHCRGANNELAPSDFGDLHFPAKIFYLGYLLLLGGLDASDVEFGTCGGRVLRQMRERGYTTVLDLVSQAPEVFHQAVVAAMPGTDVLVINEIEAGNAFGVNLRKADDSIDNALLSQIGAKFFDLGLHQELVIHFPEGAYARLADGTECRINSYIPPKVVGSVGAGDAFCAGILYALHEGLELEDSLHLAAANAIFNLMDASATGGAVPIAQVREFMATHSPRA